MEFIEHIKSWKFQDLTWDKYGKLTVLWYAGKMKWKTSWHCKCDCWNIKIVYSNSLKLWATRSCGCINLTRLSKHGLSNTRWMNIWVWMNQRCSNNKHRYYHNYWGRWIKCEWDNIIDFHNDMKDGYSDDLSIDRIDNNWNYCKENCRWATMKQQWNNRRNNINENIRNNEEIYRKTILSKLKSGVEFNGKRLSLSEWARIQNIPYSVVSSRMNMMWWTDKEALGLVSRIGKHIWEIYWWCEIIKNKWKWVYVFRCHCGLSFTRKLSVFKKRDKKHCWCLYYTNK